MKPSRGNEKAEDVEHYTNVMTIMLGSRRSWTKIAEHVGRQERKVHEDDSISQVKPHPCLTGQVHSCDMSFFIPCMTFLLFHSNVRVSC